MARQLISSGSTFEQEIGYSRAVVDGEWVFVSGTTGFDYSTMAIPEGLVEQAEQCLKNIAAALEQAGSSLRDVVRVTYVLPRADEFAPCWPVLRRYFGEVRPGPRRLDWHGCRSAAAMCTSSSRCDHLPEPARSVARCVQWASSSSTSNFSVALGGITPPAPRAP